MPLTGVLGASVPGKGSVTSGLEGDPPAQALPLEDRGHTAHVQKPR